MAKLMNNILEEKEKAKKMRNTMSIYLIDYG